MYRYHRIGNICARFYLKPANSRVCIATNKAYLKIFPADVLGMIDRGEEGWEEIVPAPVADMIKAKNLFGYESGDHWSRGRPRSVPDRTAAV